MNRKRLVSGAFMKLLSWTLKKLFLTGINTTLIFQLILGGFLTTELFMGEVKAVENCKTGYSWSKRHNRCVLSKISTNSRARVNECKGLEGEQFRACLEERGKELADTTTKNLEYDGSSGTVSEDHLAATTGALSVGLGLASWEIATKGTASGFAKASMIVAGAAGLALLLGEVLVYNKVVNNMADLEEKYLKETNKEDVAQKEAQKQAFNFLIDQQTSIRDAAETKTTFYKIAEVAYLAAAALAVTELILVANLDPLKMPKSLEEKTLFAEIDNSTNDYFMMKENLDFQSGDTLQSPTLSEYEKTRMAFHFMKVNIDWKQIRPFVEAVSQFILPSAHAGPTCCTKRPSPAFCEKEESSDPCCGTELPLCTPTPVPPTPTPASNPEDTTDNNADTTDTTDNNSNTTTTNSSNVTRDKIENGDKSGAEWYVIHVLMGAGAYFGGSAILGDVMSSSLAVAAVRVGVFTTLGFISEHLYVRTRKQVKIRQNNIAKLTEARDQFQIGTAGIVECSATDREDTSKIECYCYHDDGKRDLTRSNSAICGAAWEKAENRREYIATNYRDTYNGSSGPRGCMTKDKKFDTKCACRSVKTGPKSCFKVPSKFKFSANTSQIAFAAGDAFKKANDQFNGNYSGAGNLDYNSLNQNAVKMKKFISANATKLNQALAQKGLHPIDLSPKGNARRVASLMKKIPPAALAKAMSNTSGVSAPATTLSGTDLKNIKDAAKKAGVKDAVGFTGSGTGISLSGGKEKKQEVINPFAYGEEEVAQQEEKVKEAMKTEYDYGNQDISSNPGASIFRILSNRYKLTGFKRLFDETQN